MKKKKIAKEIPDKGYLLAVANLLMADGNAIVRTKDIRTFLQKLDDICNIKALEVEVVLPENQSYIELVNQSRHRRKNRD